MGSWGYKTFEDDTALDWLGTFRKHPSLEALTSAFRDALSEECPNDLAAAAALGAAEVVAAINRKAIGCLSPDKNEPAAAWAAKQPPPSAELRASATAAVRHVFEKSELRDIWADAGPKSLQSWQAEIDSLIERLT